MGHPPSRFSEYPRRTAMARPKWGWAFYLVEGERWHEEAVIARAELNGKRSMVYAGEVPFAFRVSRRDFALEFEDVVVAEARVNGFGTAFDVRIYGDMLDPEEQDMEASDLYFRLRTVGLLRGRYELQQEDVPIGVMKPVRWFSRDLALRLPPSLPPAVQAFLVGLVNVMRQRQSSS